MAYKYLNPGHMALFDEVTTGAESTLEKYNKENKIAFNPNGGYCTLFLESATEYWVKFGLYADYIGNGAIISIQAGENKIIIEGGGGTASVHIRINTETKENFSLKAKEINTIELHARSNAENGIAELYVEGIKKAEYAGNILGGLAIEKIGFTNGYGFSSVNFFSNIIVQNTGRIGSEKIAILPVASTEGWTGGAEGSYTAANEGETLLQTVNVDVFKGNIGYTAMTQINSIAICGINTFYESGTLNALQSITKNGEAIQEIEFKKIGTAETGGVYYKAMLKNPFSGGNWTTEGIQSTKFGFKAKAAE